MRHRQRHVHQTIVHFLREQLTDLGWVTVPINFASTPITLIDYEPQQAGVNPAPNTVAVSIGHQGETEAAELGAGLHSCSYVVFIDIYPVNEPIGVAIGDDVKECLLDEILSVLDFTTTADGILTDEQIEFESILVEVVPSPSGLDKRSWRAVKTTAVVYF